MTLPIHTFTAPSKNSLYSPAIRTIFNFAAEAGLGRFVKPTADHLRRVADLLDACPNWYTDLSWDIIQQYIIAPGPAMPPLTEWAAFARKYQDRILWGSDTVIFTKNRIDTNGKVVAGGLMPVDEYRLVAHLLDPL